MAAIALASLLAATQGSAETDAAAAAIEAAELLQNAAVSLAEAEGARDRVEALTETVRAYEEGLSALREGVRQAALRERAILAVFEAERERLGRLLAVLQSIQSAPAPLLLLHPDGPVGTARAGHDRRRCHARRRPRGAGPCARSSRNSPAFAPCRRRG
jgi:hypothetical protein